MRSESALIVPVPEVEPVVGRLRLLYDPAAQLGVPAHITLLYPFGSPRAACDAINRLEDLFASFQAFRFAFTQVRRFPATTYLHPDRAEAFAQIIRTLMKPGRIANLMAEPFPKSFPTSQWPIALGRRC